MKLFLVCEVLVLILGLTIAISRGVRSPAFFPLRLFATVYTDVFRGLPVILVIYAIGFGVPALVSPGCRLDPAVLGGFALALCYSAYVAEVYRAGIDSVHPAPAGGGALARPHEGQAMRFVVLPAGRAARGPPLLNDFIALKKDVALVSILGPRRRSASRRSTPPATSTTRP